MTITKCDRCGTEIRYDLPERYRVAVSINQSCVSGVEAKFDLCLPCREALVAWIREAET